MSIRRVVTGHNEQGQAVFASDEAVEPIVLSLMPGMEFFRMWGSDETCSFPDDGSQPSNPAYFPPLHGFRFALFTVAPNTAVLPDDLDIDKALAEVEQALPGMAAHMEPDNPGMHTTATVDFEFVVSGRVVLELDNGATRELSAGDTVVQNGTRHAWRNPYEEPCQMVVVLVGANHNLQLTLDSKWR